MALLEGTIAIIIYIIVIVLLFKLLRSVVKTILLGMLLVLAVFGVVTYLVYVDATDFYENFPNSSKTFYLGDGENLLAGVSMVSFTESNMTYIKLKELEELEGSYSDEDFKDMIKDDYKIFIFDISIFNESLEEGMDFETGNLKPIHIDGDKLNESLYSDEPLDIIYGDFADDFIVQQVKAGKLPKQVIENETWKENVKEEFIDLLQENSDVPPGQARAMIFGFLLKSEINNDMVREMYLHYREGSLKIYKDTPMFKLLKFAPSSLINKILDKVSGKMEEKNEP